MPCLSRLAGYSRGRVLVGGGLAALMFATMGAPTARAARATSPAAEHSFNQFLAKTDDDVSYHAIRRLEAENGNRKGWLDVATQYSPQSGFRYEVIAEGGSGYIRDKVLRVVLNAERDAIARGQMSRAALAPENYTFEPHGVGADGLTQVLISPRRKEHALIDGVMFLTPEDGVLVRLQGKLVKSPSFWVKSAEVVRAFDRLNGKVVPVALESNAQLRMFGAASLRMTYRYTEVDGSPVAVAAR